MMDGMQGQPMYGNPYGYPDSYVKVDNKDPTFLQWFLDIKEGIETLKFLWRGYERDSKGIWHKGQFSDERRIMNDKGIHWATSLMESYLDKVMQGTSWNEDHMNWEMRKAYRSVWFGLMVQWRDFEISKVNVQVVANSMLAKIHAMLLSARGEGIRNFLTKTQSVQEIKQVMPNENRGFLSGIQSIFRRGDN